MFETINSIVAWTATVFRAGGMLAKKPMMVKSLVSVGNLGWMLSGIMTGNVPLIVSNAICLVVMVVEIIRNKRGEKHASKKSN